jgi:peptidoglycan/LPS O-acetylase OafA/YrhL
LQTLADFSQFSRREVDALLLGIRPLLLALSAHTECLELGRHLLNGARELGQLGCDGGDVLSVGHAAGFYAASVDTKAPPGISLPGTFVPRGLRRSQPPMATTGSTAAARPPVTDGADGRFSRLTYLPQLDGLRGVAVSLVVLHHALGWPAGGFIGVDLFFVLSGFLITTLLLQEWAHRGTIALGAFWLRRILRLYPALVFLLIAYLGYVLLVYAVGSSHASAPVTGALRGTLYGAFYVTNVAMATDAIVPPALAHLWSLSTEEQFYLLWAPVLLLALRLGARRRQLTALLVVAIAIAFAHRLWLTHDGAAIGRLYFAPDGHFDVILVGCVAGVWFASGIVPRPLQSAWGRRLCTAVAVIGLTAVTLSYELDARALYWGLLTLVAVAAAVLIFAISIDDRSLASRTLRLRPLVALGKISYGVYLWQSVIIFGVARFPGWLEIVLSIAAATVSYVLVEQRFLRLKARNRKTLDSLPPAVVPRAAASGAR